jgi:hypothetical protein
MSSTEELRSLLAELAPHRIAELRDFAEFLRAKDRGSAPIALDGIFGTLSAERAAAMEQVINEGCERIDANAW